MAATRFFTLFLVTLFLPAVARAHAAWECTASLAADSENIELTLVLSALSIPRLLGEGTPVLGEDTFESLRPALLRSAPDWIALADAQSAPIPAQRVFVSFAAGHEVRFRYLFPAAAAPARLAFPLLSRFPREAFCLFSDLRCNPPARAALVPSRPGVDLLSR